MVVALVVLDLLEATALAFHAKDIMEKSVEDMDNVNVMETVLVILDGFLPLLLSNHANVLLFVLEIVMVMVLVIVVFVTVMLTGIYYLTVLVLSLVLMIVMEMEYATVMERAHVILAIAELFAIKKKLVTTKLAMTV